MKQNLDDVVLFLSVADAGGPAGAARATGQSPPTPSRRMTALERQPGRRLFERRKRGFALTASEALGALPTDRALRPAP